MLKAQIYYKILKLTMKLRVKLSFAALTPVTVESGSAKQLLLAIKHNLDNCKET